MPKKSKRKLVNNNFLKLEKKAYKSIKIKSKFETEKSKKSKIIRISFYILLSILFFFFAFKVVFKKYKKQKKLNKIEKADNKTELLPFEPNNEEFFNNLLNTINTEDKYKGAKECYYNDTDSCLYKYFCPKKAVGKNLKYYGLLKDGGYVLTDDLSDIKIAYSFGVNEEFSFEMQLADKGIDVYMYDPSVKSLNFTKYNIGQDKNFSNDINYYQKKLHFFSIGVTGSQNHQNNMKTLLEMMKDNGHLNEKNMILKMDIESAEWDVLKDLSDEDMKRFKYLSFELHLGKTKPKDYYPDVIKKLSKFHQVIFIRFNDWGHIIEFGYNRFCSCIELTYIIKEGNEFERDNSIYPLKDFNYTNGGNHKLDFDINVFKLFYHE